MPVNSEFRRKKTKAWNDANVSAMIDDYADKSVFFVGLFAAIMAMLLVLLHWRRKNSVAEYERLRAIETAKEAEGYARHFAELASKAAERGDVDSERVLRAKSREQQRIASELVGRSKRHLAG